MVRKLLIVFLLAGSSLKSFSQENTKIYNEIGSPLPAMKIFTYDKKYLTDKDLKNDANLILMLFNPTCEHCEDQARTFRDNIGLFKNSNLLLIAAASMVPHLEYFRNVSGIKEYQKIMVGVDSLDFVDKTFRYVTLPQINIYNKERKLVKMFYGTTPIDSLKRYIE